MSNFWIAALFFGGGFACAWALTQVLVRRGKRGFGLDHPDEHRKRHTLATPRTGGAAIFVAVALMFGAIILLPLEKLPMAPALLLCNGLIFALGFCDDLKAMNSRLKLLGQIAIAVLAWALGLRIELLANPFGGEFQLSGAVSLLATVLWLVSVPNIINLIDGMDGLATGLGLFLCITLGIVGLLSPFQQAMGILCIGVAGALAAFLIFNFPPAKIFLGDGGAYLIGFFIASISLGTSQKSHIAASLCVTLIALGLPLLDTAFAIARRWFRGVPVMRGDAEHFHHQLLGLGHSSNRALFLIYGVCIVFAIAGLSVYLSEGATLSMSIALVIVVGIVAARYVGYIRSWRKFTKDFRRIVRTRREVRYANLHSHVLLLEVERCQSAAEFWKRFRETMELSRIFVRVEPGAQADEIVLQRPAYGVLSWTLYHFNDTERYNWRTIAQCFTWPFELGVKKWGLPVNWGLELANEADLGMSKEIEEPSSEANPLEA